MFISQQKLILVLQHRCSRWSEFRLKKKKKKRKYSFKSKILLMCPCRNICLSAYQSVCLFFLQIKHALFPAALVIQTCVVAAIRLSSYLALVRSNKDPCEINGSLSAIIHSLMLCRIKHSHVEWKDVSDARKKAAKVTTGMDRPHGRNSARE